jgi:membrane protease YdiL (CAAX protease family)
MGLIGQTAGDIIRLFYPVPIVGSRILGMILPGQSVTPLPLPEPTPRISYPITLWVVAFIAVVYIFFPALTTQLLLAANFGPRLNGPPTPEQMAPLSRLYLIAGALAFPLQIAAVVFLLPRFAGVRLEQIGLTWRCFGRNCLKGVDGWQILTPVCLALNYGILWLYGAQAASNVHEHPLVELAQNGLSLGEVFLFIAAVTVTAPVMEEMLFRGALQTWLERQPLGGPFIMLLALLTSVPGKKEAWTAAWAQGGGALLLHGAPILFVLALLPIYFLVRRWSRTSAWPALFAASTLFAAVHSFAWPSPVPLFILALGLGWLAQRTRSLAGPMVLHGLFNGVNCVILFWR